jgi:thiol-disulfide isomerase/thioredoxin
MMINAIRKRRAMLGIGIFLGLLAIVSPTLSAAAKAKGADMKVDAKVKVPAIIAVRVRHDMCPFCKELDPQLPGLVRDTGDAAVLFVTLDLSDENTQKQAALMVGALGLDRVWTGDLSKIGSITFVDGTTQEELSFVRSTNIREIKAALRKALDVRGK